MIVLKMPCSTGPTTLIVESTLPPKLATITRDTEANKKLCVSDPVTLRNPTMSPRTISTDVTPGPIGQNPATMAISKPTIKAQLPTFCTIDTFFIIVDTPLLVLFN